MKTLVVTSVNPHGKFAYQKHCFDAWKTAGYHIITMNCVNEAQSLIEQGFDAADIEILTEGETAQNLFGRPIPRVLPVLNRAKHYNHDATILTNSDIYPSHNRPVSQFLAGINDTLALTRNECVNLGDHRFTDSTAYRGGLDIFFFTREGLTNTFAKLCINDLSERMTFGVPGWDYYLGYHLIYGLNGTVLDGEVFLHQSHKTTYNQINEFSLYADEMKTSGHFRGQDSVAIAAEFSQLIHAHCDTNLPISRTLKTAFFQAPTALASAMQTTETAAVQDRLNDTLIQHGVAIALPPLRVKSFINSQLNGLSWSAAESFKETQMKKYPVVTGYLYMLLTQLLIKQHLGCHRVSLDYPKGNVHGIALRQILHNTRGQEQLMYLIRLFSAELIDHGIFNTTLFKYITWSANSDYALGLCNAVFELCKEDK